MKTCEVCKKEIPEDYGNALCDDCYNKQVKELDAKKLAEEEERKEKGKELSTAPNPPEEPIKSDKTPSKHGITDPNYKENPEVDDMEQWKCNILQFEHTGDVFYKETRNMYTFIKNYLIRTILDHPQYPKYIWKPSLVDVGCGCGVGTNLVSQECDFAWGIDKNLKSVQFAKTVFNREKNGRYYTPQVSFDHIDILQDTREFLRFDFVLAIEVIEHIFDYKKFLGNIIRFAKRNKKMSYNVKSGPTEFFISTPNRNWPKLSVRRPTNKFHVREWTAQEYHAILSEFFEKVEFMNCKGEPLPFDTDKTPILSKCLLPIFPKKQ